MAAQPTLRVQQDATVPHPTNCFRFVAEKEVLLGDNNTRNAPPPQLPGKRVHVLQPNLPLGSHPHVRDHGPCLDRVAADKVGDGAEGRGQGVTEVSEALALEEGHPPAVDVVPRAPTALAEAAEGEAEVCRRVRLGREGGGGWYGVVRKRNRSRSYGFT